MSSNVRGNVRHMTVWHWASMIKTCTCCKFIMDCKNTWQKTTKINFSLISVNCHQWNLQLCWWGVLFKLWLYYKNWNYNSTIIFFFFLRVLFDLDWANLKKIIIGSRISTYCIILIQICASAVFVCCIFLRIKRRASVWRIMVDLHVFLSSLRTWGSRKWVIWREFFRELRIWPRPPWLTCNLTEDNNEKGNNRKSWTSLGALQAVKETIVDYGKQDFIPRNHSVDVNNMHLRCVWLCQRDSWGSWRKCKRKSQKDLYNKSHFLSYPFRTHSQVCN